MREEENPNALVVLSGAALTTAVITLLTRPKPIPDAEKLDYLIELQEMAVRQLQRLIELAEARPPVVPLPATIIVPLDPEVLNRALQAVMPRGKVMFPTWRIAWSCPAGTTTETPLLLPEGFLCTRREARLYSTYYSKDIVIYVYVDDKLVTPYGLTMTGAAVLDFGEFFVKRRKVDVNTVNNSTTDAIITLEVVASLVEKSFYEEWYAPIIDYMYRGLSEIAR